MKWTTIKRKINDLIPYENNPRQMTEKQNQDLTESLKKFDLVEIPAINQDGTIIAGHQRIRILQALGRGEEEIDVRVPDRQLSEKELQEYNIRSNKNIGEWDFDALANNFEVGDLLEWGFDEHELKIEATTEDEAPEASTEPAVSKLGEIYKLGNHRLICGDATKIEDVIKLMDEKKGRMVFTDPPYNVDYTRGMSGDNFKSKRLGILNDKMSSEKFYKFLYDAMGNLISVVDGAFYVCMSSSELHNLWRAFTEAGGHWQTYIIWVKDTFTLSRSDYQHQFEPIMYGWTRHSWYGGRKQGDVWRFDRPKISKEHPTMKPIALCGRAITNRSNREDIIVDTFAGSGSTLIACEQLGRSCYSMELDPAYCDVIRKRYANLIGKGDQWQTITPKI
jgi:DNA modification methylase